MRLGPKPLPFQLGMASLASAGFAGGTVFDAQTLQDFFKGIQKYQAHSFKREMAPLETVWAEGQARLFHASARNKKHAVPIVLIPSMINKSDILDLLPDRSLVRWLAEQGFDTYLFDWGTPTEDEAQANFDLALQERLVPAIQSLSGPVLLLGYCMGGLFAASIAAQKLAPVHGLAMLASPWNFHDEKGYLKNRMSVMRPMAEPYMAQYQRLPESWMQAVFASLDPEGSIRKFSSFANMPEGPRADMFVAVEDWLNEGIDLPSGIAKTCFADWYELNLPYKGEWIVAGEPVYPKSIDAPVFAVAARDDRIVPADSANAFATQCNNATSIICPTGHVGLIAGKKAIEDVWTPLAEWFAAQQ
jgi:polyhydroxyalkanoate synthase